MIPVILESPYSGEVVRNKLYLACCIRDCIRRGESPYASHQMLTEALDDTNLKEREIGINAARSWYEFARYSVVYTDYGISGGMFIGIDRMTKLVKRIEYRKLGEGWLQGGGPL